MILYRGDSRNPELIKQQGFMPRKPRSIDEVRKHLLTYCTPPKAPLDLSRLIISSPQPEFVSTDVDEDCGGYSDGGYIYKISIDELQKKEWSSEVLGPDAKVKRNMLNPELYLNASKLADATIIAIKSYGNSVREVTFLTPIYAKHIVAYKKSRAKDFIPLS